MTEQPGVGLVFALDAACADPLYKATVAKVVRRFMAADIKDGPESIAQILSAWSKTDPTPVIEGMAKALEGGRMEQVPAPLAAPLAALRRARPTDELLVEVLARMNDGSALAALRERLANGRLAESVRLKAAKLLAQVRDPGTKPLLLAQVGAAKSDAYREGVLAALTAYDDPAVGTAVLDAFAGWGAKAKRQALVLLTSRPSWAAALLPAHRRRHDSERRGRAGPRARRGRPQRRPRDGAGREALGQAGPRHRRGEDGPHRLAVPQIPRHGPGDAAAGKAIFTKACAACHTLFGEGGKVGPDLTTADRRNRGYMLAQIVDPSGYIRPEYVVQAVTTHDGRRLSGIVTASTAEAVTLVNVVNDQPQTATFARPTSRR